jgi:hypothetical protein
MWRAHDRSRLAVQVFLFGVFLSMLLLEEHTLGQVQNFEQRFCTLEDEVIH